MFEFFPKEEKKKKNVKDKRPSCFGCSLNKKECHTKVEGKGGKGILILLSAPHSNENILGGITRRELMLSLKKFGIDIERDCFIVPAVLAPTNKHEDPKDADIHNCRVRVMSLIKECEPKMILAVGGGAMKSIAQHRAIWKGTGFPSIHQFRGYVIPDQEMKCYVVPVYDPIYIAKQKENEQSLYNRFFEKDIEAGLEATKKPFVVVDHLRNIIIPTNEKEAYEKLEEAYKHIKENKCLTSFDYETTGIKPYDVKHKIVSFAISFVRNKQIETISVRVTREIAKVLCKILSDEDIPMTAHNMSFEEHWSREKLKLEVQNWYMDTIIGTHVLDNRTGTKSLKFQSYVNTGILGYETEIEAYISSDKSSDNAFNNMDKAPTHILLLYNAIDAYCGLRLAMIYSKRLTELDLWEPYMLLHEGVLALCDAECNGAPIDVEHCTKASENITKEIEEIKQKMLEYPEVKKWKDKLGEDFNLASNKQLGELIYGEMGVEVLDKTSTGQASTSKASLNKLDIPFTQDLLEIRKREKIKSTYIDALVKECTYGYVHPFFPLYTAVSYRSSSYAPNFQNVQKHNEEAKKLIRSAYIAGDEYCICEADYSGVEVRVGAANHKDKNMIKYIFDETTDMHRDTAADLYMLPHDQIPKSFRQSAKNGFVFPEFYGDWYVACAENIWKNYISKEEFKLEDGTHATEWLKSKGINRLGEFKVDDGEGTFINHCKKVEDLMWKVRFKQYAKWKDAQYETYKKNLEFRSSTGFRYTGILSRKETGNYGIQGSAFHCLLWSFIKVAKWLKENKMKTKLMGEIHDAIVLRVHKSEIDIVMPMLRKIMLDDLMATWKWINVPLDVDIELAPVGASWYDVKNIKERKEPCACGVHYGYKDKKTGAWSCPVCKHIA